MRLTAIVLTACLPVAAQADLATTGPTPVGNINFNTSLSVNVPLLATDPEGRTAEEDAYRKALYARAVGECAALLEAVAKTCTITAVNVSTQVNANPGQPVYLYATANITMAAELK